MAGSGEVLLEVDGGVAIVTLNAPDRRNALTPGMADELIATFDEVDTKPEVGALVIRGVGKSFCAGGDVATLTNAGKDPATPDAYEGMGKIYDSFYRLGQVRVPTVAAVRGSAVGAGMNMLLAADLRIVAKDVRLLAGFLRRGMHPGGGHFVILSRLIGREAAAAMALFGEKYVSLVIPDDPEGTLASGDTIRKTEVPNWATPTAMLPRIEARNMKR